VKELGPGDGKVADANLVAAGAAALSPQKSDMELLRNANVSPLRVYSNLLLIHCLYDTIRDAILTCARKPT